MAFIEVNLGYWDRQHGMVCDSTVTSYKPQVFINVDKIILVRNCSGGIMISVGDTEIVYTTESYENFMNRLSLIK